MQTRKCHSFSTAVTLKIRSRSPKYNHFFGMSQLYIHANLVRIQTLVQDIEQTRKCDVKVNAKARCQQQRDQHQKQCPPDLRWRDIIAILLGLHHRSYPKFTQMPETNSADSSEFLKKFLNIRHNQYEYYTGRSH